ncbi:MAG: flagellar hook-length control protein FliK, partial [Desulfobacteraceae bacterium]
NLERIVKGMPDHGRSLPDPVARRQTAKLINGMGIPVAEGTVTLDRFVSELRAKIAGTAERSTSQKETSAQLNRFMDNIGPGEKADPRKSIDTARIGLLQKEASAVHPGKAVPEPQTHPHPSEDTKGEIRLVPSIENAPAKPANIMAGPAVEEAKPQTRTLPSYVVQQVSRQILHSHQNGVREIQLQLHPPNLGRIQVNIDTTGDAIRVRIVTEQQGAQELIASQSGDLKAVLSEQGLRVEKIDVQYDHFFDQALADTRQNHSRSRGQHQRGSGGRMVRKTDSPDSPFVEGREKRLHSADSLLDLVA